jgi:integrating conjugative element protein (TIGR03755 family)
MLRSEGRVFVYRSRQDLFMKQKKRLINNLVLGLITMVPIMIHAIESPTTDGLYYYKIGGGRHISIPPSLTIETLPLSLTGSYSGLNCGKFDPVASIESSLDNLKDGVDNAINAVEAAASAAIANLPGYILQKANPGLYDLFQNGLLRAQESFSLATKSCERMQYEISNNINPYAEWITLSRGDSWKASIGVGEENIHTAQETAVDAHNDGVSWVGGLMKGGVGQEPIRLLSDIATAGINILSQRPPETQADLPFSSPLRDHFEGPDALNTWITEVLGDLIIGTCDGCTPGSQPGKGLIPHIEQTSEEIKSLLIDLITGNTPPTRENLDRVAAPGIAITLQVVNAIKNQPSKERAITIDKLAQEVAEARVMEEAMVVRRLLLTGSKEGHVSANTIALKEVKQALNELHQEIDNVIFEKRIRKELVSHTVVEVLLKDYADRQSSVNVPASLPNDSRPLQQGRVKQ